MEKKIKANAWGLLPIAIFLVFYLGLGILFEYALGIEMGFYNIPIVVGFLIAILVACLQNRSVSFEEKLSVMASNVGDKNIITMILIFLASGLFVGVTGRSSAESVAYFMFSIAPAKMAPIVLFIVACVVSIAMGTSTGTITLITPIAIAVSEVSGFSLPLCIGTVAGGAMFGDNLSFISDTTIAACTTQGCAMKDKFKTNFKIACPAAIVSLILIGILSMNVDTVEKAVGEYNMFLFIPYLLVLIFGIMGINVFIVLIIGIIAGIITSLAVGVITPMTILTSMRSGIEGMYETILVAVLVSALCGLIKNNGGFEALLSFVKKYCKSNKSGQFGMGLLVGAMDIATANNTVAIVIAGPIAKNMSKDYNISPQKAASILDTFSCVFQIILPYGAQMLLAVSAATVLGYTVSPFEIMPYLFYPVLLGVFVVLSIVFSKEKTTEDK